MCQLPSGRTCRPTRQGLTFVELAVCIGLIAILVSLILIGVQHSRESSRRTDCMNRLRQLGIGIQSHINATGFLPDSEAEKHTIRGLNWEVDIYPGPIIKSLRYVSGYERAYENEIRTGADFDPAEEIFVRRKKPPSLLQCPSNGSEFGTSYRANIGPGEIAYSHSLKVLRDLGIDSPGPFAMFLKLHSSMVSRGLSQTAGFSETIPGVSRFKVFNIHFPWSEFPPALPDRSLRWDERCLQTSKVDSPARFLGMQGPPCGGRIFETYYTHRKAPNSAFPLCYAYKQRLGIIRSGDTGITATSNHSGGVNLCYLDGSVHFFGSATDEKLWKEISTIQPLPHYPATDSDPSNVTAPDTRLDSIGLRILD